MSLDTIIADMAPPRALLVDYMGTAEIEGEDLSTFDQRLGQCYWLAGTAVVDGDLGDGILVHGTIHGRGWDLATGVEAFERIGHAWVIMSTEPGQPRQIWEPISGKVHDKREWYAYTRAREERLYDETQARIQLLRHRHWGRWHESNYP